MPPTADKRGETGGIFRPIAASRPWGAYAARTSTNRANWIGLGRKSVTPAALAAARSSGSTLALLAITGRVSVAGWDRGVGQVEFLAGHDDQALQRANRHRTGGSAHPCGQLVRAARAASGVGEEQHRMPVKGPVTPQVLHHLPRQRHHPVAAALAATHHQLALVALDVVHRQRKAFRKPQPRAVNQLHRRAVTPQPDRPQQPRHLLAREHCGQLVVVASAHLREHPPLAKIEHLDKEKPRARHRLPDRLRTPSLDRLHMQDVVAQRALAQRGRIDPEVLVQQTHGPVVTVPRPVRVVPQRQQLGIPPHRVVGMPVAERIAMTLPRPGVDALQECATLALLWLDDGLHQPPPFHSSPTTSHPADNPYQLEHSIPCRAAA